MLTDLSTSCTVAYRFIITSDFMTDGAVGISGFSFPENFSVTPGTITTVNLPGSAEATSPDVVTDLGINIQADDEITVYGLSLRQFSTDAFLGLPVDI